MVALIYSILLGWLLYHNQLFGLFKDSSLSKQRLLVLFVIKLMALVFFYWAYNRDGGLERSDAGKFFHDAHVIAKWGQHHPSDFMSFLLGNQDDKEGSAMHEACFTHTYNWNTGRTKDFFYNDNRIVIRLHALIDWLARGNYFVHALMAMMMGLYGLFLLSKTFSALTSLPMSAFFTVGTIFPAVWFYTAAPLKEPYVVLVCGQLAYSAYQLFSNRFNNNVAIRFLFFSVMALLLKPYVCGTWLVMIVLSGLAYRLGKGESRRVTLYFLVGLIGVIGLANFAATQYKQRSLLMQMRHQQKQFVISSRGGMYLSGGSKYIRMHPDRNLVVSVGQDSLYKIKKGVSYAYWEDAHPDDSLFIQSNTDTNGVYVMQDFNLAGRSNIAVESYGNTWPSQLLHALFYGTLYPLPWQIRGGLQPLMGMENMLILASLLLCLFGSWKIKSTRLLMGITLLLAITLCVLPGFTAPNSGAIFRYRMLGALLFIFAGLFVLKQLYPNNRYISKL